MILCLCSVGPISILQKFKTLLIIINRLQLRSLFDFDDAILAGRAPEQLCDAISQQRNGLESTARSRRRDGNDKIGFPVSGLGKIGSSLTEIGSYRFIGVIFEPV